jgi:[acyl-carrier-protein] S-malonyltransferase
VHFNRTANGYWSSINESEVQKMKIGYVFAGQGAQKEGMGQAFYDQFENARVVYDRANLALGYDLKSLCFNGPQTKLNETEITQPAILTTSIAMLKAFESKINIKPTAVAGLSLGEYTAHVASGSIAFDDAVQLVKKRGAFMQEAVPMGVGGMVAIMGLSVEDTERVAAEASAYGTVEVCNYNSPKQIVLGGELKALAKVETIAKDAGAKRALPLPVSAPFHTSMLKPAEEQLAVELETIRFGEMKVPVISNVNGRIVPSEGHIPDYLAKQVTSAVRWIECIESMTAMGIDTIVEFGPGTALSSFIAKINRTIKVLSINDIDSLNQAVDYLSAQHQVRAI